MSSTEETRAAVVLAGGRSTRFGDADKVFARLDGRSLLARVVARVDPVVDSVVVSCREDQRQRVRRRLGDAADVTVVTDPIPDCGPVAGLTAALRACEADAVALCAADEPFVDPSLLDALLARREEAGADCVIPRGPDGWLQPTQSVYRAAAVLDSKEETGADASLRSLVDRLESVVVPAPTVERRADAHAFHDVNTRADLERAKRYLAAGRA